MHGRTLRALLQPPPKGTKTSLKRPRPSPPGRRGSPQGSAPNPHNTEPRLRLENQHEGPSLRDHRVALPPGLRRRLHGPVTARQAPWPAGGRPTCSRAPGKVTLTAREECLQVRSRPWGPVPDGRQSPQTLGAGRGQLPHDSALAGQPPKQVTARPSRPTSRKARAHREGRRQKVKLQHRPQHCFLKQTPRSARPPGEAAKAGWRSLSRQSVLP